MYDYPHYKEDDRKEIFDFMQAHPFITLIGCDTRRRIEATQIPVIIEERNGKIYLRGHIAKKSDHHRAFEENAEVLALFTGAHTYVSGSWYAGNPQQASTWNYIAIHARGTLQFLDDASLVDILKRTSLHFEKYDTSSSTVYDNLPPDYLAKLVKAILPFEIEVTESDNVFKLSQNRDERSYDSIVAHLIQQGGEGKEIGDLMAKRKSKVFHQ